MISIDFSLVPRKADPAIRPVRQMRVLLIVASLAFMLCVPGCKNPFHTRKSPPPVTETGGTWKTPSEPEDVVDNLFYAYNEMVAANFDRCLCDSFRFSAPEDSAQAVQDNRAELFADWDRRVELRVASQIFSLLQTRPDSISLELRFDPDPPVPDDVSDSTAILERDYELVIIDMKADPWHTVTAQGTATFQMRQTSLNWWCIYFWRDVPKKSGDYDWGDFKAQFR
jgi:hypothetical protein